MQPLREFLENRTSANVCTPDMHKLTRMFDAIPLFVYGTEKRQFSESYYLNKAQYHGEGRTADVQFFMTVTESDAPVVLRDFNGGPKVGAIQGELFTVTPDQLAVLDMKMCNTMLCQRFHKIIRWTPKEHTSQKAKMAYFTEAFIYIGKDEYWNDERLGKCKLAPRYVDRTNTPYFIFTMPLDEENKKWQKRL